MFDGAPPESDRPQREMSPVRMRDGAAEEVTYEEEAFASPVVLDGKTKKCFQTEARTMVIENLDSEEEDAKATGPFTRAINAITHVVHKIIPPGGILSSAFSLASGSLGAGILGLPGGSDTSGLVLAVIYLVIITFFSVFSMHILAVTTMKTNIKTFEGLGRWLFPWGNYAFSYWVAFIRWFYSFGACVGYVISVGDCFKPIFADAYKNHPDSSALRYFNTTSGIRLLQALVWLCIMLPLVVPKHIDSLRYASTFAVTMMMYFVLVIIIHSCTNGLPEHRHNVRLSGRRDAENEGPYIYLFRTGNDAMSALGVFMFAYVCQINALEVLLDMSPEIRTPRNFTYAALIGMLICGTLYLFVSIFGYFDFGSARLQSNSILLMYNPIEDTYMMVAYVGVLCKLCVSYALLSMAARNSIYYVIGWQQKYQTPKHKRNPVMDAHPGAQEVRDDDYLPGDSFAGDPRLGDQSNNSNNNSKADAPVAACASASAQPTTTTSESGGENSTAPATTTAAKKGGKKAHAKEAVGDSVFVDNIPMWKHLLVVGILAVIALLCGLFIPNIKIVFGFAGAISGGFLAFIFPALFFMYAGDFTREKVGNFLYFTTYLLLLCGVIGVVFGTGATIYSTVGGQ